MKDVKRKYKTLFFLLKKRKCPRYANPLDSTIFKNALWVVFFFLNNAGTLGNSNYHQNQHKNIHIFSFATILAKKLKPNIGSLDETNFICTFSNLNA